MTFTITTQAIGTNDLVSRTFESREEFDALTDAVARAARPPHFPDPDANAIALLEAHNAELVEALADAHKEAKAWQAQLEAALERPVLRVYDIHTGKMRDATQEELRHFQMVATAYGLAQQSLGKIHADLLADLGPPTSSNLGHG